MFGMGVCKMLHIFISEESLGTAVRHGAGFRQAWGEEVRGPIMESARLLGILPSGVLDPSLLAFCPIQTLE